MLSQTVTIARKEITDSVRDTRALFSSFLHAAMGPAVVFLVSLTLSGSQNSKVRLVLAGMMSVFILVSAFAGAMNVAMDVLAGERERRSLLPLLMSVRHREAMVAGKWLAVSVFALAALGLNVAGFAYVFGRIHLLPPLSAGPLFAIGAGLVPLALLAAAIELGISTICANVKEAQTYLSMMVFLPMGLGMFAVFYPEATEGWGRFLPLMGQQWQLSTWASGAALPVMQTSALCMITLALTAAVLWVVSRLLERDHVLYGR